MVRECSECGAKYDDEYRWTICPHETFAANDGKNNFAHHPKSVLRFPTTEEERKKMAGSGQVYYKDGYSPDNAVDKYAKYKLKVSLNPEQTSYNFLLQTDDGKTVNLDIFISDHSKDGILETIEQLESM